jgi:hypothetical protein
MGDDISAPKKWSVRFPTEIQILTRCQFFGRFRGESGRSAGIAFL